MISLNCFFARIFHFLYGTNLLIFHKESFISRMISLNFFLARIFHFLSNLDYIDRDFKFYFFG